MVRAIRSSRSRDRTGLPAVMGAIPPWDRAMKRPDPRGLLRCMSQRRATRHSASPKRDAGRENPSPGAARSVTSVLFRLRLVRLDQLLLYLRRHRFVVAEIE
jgi:hypothetical protein